MNEHTNRQDALRDRLRADAAIDSPAFSQVLHDRILSAVGRERQAEVRQSPKAIVWRLAVAAIVLLALGAAIWSRLAKQPIEQAPLVIDPPKNAPLPLPAPDNVLALQTREMQNEIHQAVSAAQFAYLDRDAERLTRYLADQLRIAPVGGSNHSADAPTQP